MANTLVKILGTCAGIALAGAVGVTTLNNNSIRDEPYSTPQSVTLDHLGAKITDEAGNVYDARKVLGTDRYAIVQPGEGKRVSMFTYIRLAGNELEVGTIYGDTIRGFENISDGEAVKFVYVGRNDREM